jgi:hypothetical protein
MREGTGGGAAKESMVLPEMTAHLDRFVSALD